jgi:hypothetical protein
VKKIRVKKSVQIAQCSNRSGPTIKIIIPLNEKAKDQTINMGYK